MEGDGFDDFPLFVVRHVLGCHGSVVSEESPITIQLRKRDVAVFRAKMILADETRAAKGRKPLLLPFSAFMQRWRRSLPFPCDIQSEAEATAVLLAGEGETGDDSNDNAKAKGSPFKISLGLLSGLVLPHVDDAARSGAGTVSLEPYAEADLSADARERFVALFAKRRKWRLAALRPYLAGLVRADPAANEGSLLLRYTRVSTTISKDAATGKAKRSKLYSAR